MYFIIRTIIFIIILIIFLVICKRKKKKIKRNTAIIFVIIWGIILSLSYFLPVENLFYTFKTPEKVFEYMSEGEILGIVDGKDSSLGLTVIDNSTTSCIIAMKSENGWKIGNSLFLKHALISDCDGISIIVYKYKEEYYVTLFYRANTENKKIYNIYDNKDSQFEQFSRKLDNESTYYGYGAYLNSFDSNYTVTINGKTYKFFNE